MNNPREPRKIPLMAVEVEIHHACNRKCSYCPNSRHERKEKGEMDPALFQKLLGQLKDLGFRERLSYHFYNEPLMNPNLFQYLKLTRTHLPEARVEIYTNGTLLTAPMVRMLFAEGVGSMVVTRHEGIDPEILNSTLGDLPSAIRDRIRIQDFRTMPLTNRAGAVPEVGPGSLTLPLRVPCYIPITLLAVTLEGNVLPCYEDYFQDAVMGNIRETHLLEIWNSEKYVKFRETLKQGGRSKHPLCQKCNNTLLVG